MKQILLITFLLVSVFVFSQPVSKTDIAQQYLKDGEYEKAISIFESEFKKYPNIKNYNSLLACYLALNNYDQAQKHIKKYLKTNKTNISLYVDLGDVFMSQGKKNQANNEFKHALDELKKNPSLTYSLGNAFYQKAYYEWALNTYLIGRNLTPNKIYNYRLADIYSQLGDVENMFLEYLDLVDNNNTSVQTIKNYLSRLISDDGENEHNQKLKAILLKTLQKQPDNVVYSDLLTWLFIQERSFTSAFNQLKALDSKTKGDQKSIYELANICNENYDYETAINCFEYIVKKGSNSLYYLDSKIGLIRVLQKRIIQENDYKKEDLITLKKNIENVLSEFGRNKITVLLMKDLAHLQAFYFHNTNEAITLLEESLMLTTSIRDLAECKLELADILVFRGNEWEAILYYAQVEKSLKEDPIGQEAKFRKARVYYYQGEFDFAKAQLDVLKASTTKLIANDAMSLSLLISDNTALDTTTDALYMFAKADLLTFQNKDELALNKLDEILMYFSDHTIVDDVKFRKGEIMLKKKKYIEAIKYFSEVENDYFFGILADDACFQIAETYYKKIRNLEKAKIYYEKILTDYKGSIFVSEARKVYRILRGDKLN